MTDQIFVGRRKTSVARVILRSGSGKITVNGHAREHGQHPARGGCRCGPAGPARPERRRGQHGVVGLKHIQYQSCLKHNGHQG